MSVSAPESRNRAPATTVRPKATTLRVPSRPASFADIGPPTMRPAAIGSIRTPASSGV